MYVIILFSQIASVKVHCEIVQLLLQFSADLNVSYEINRLLLYVYVLYKHKSGMCPHLIVIST